MAKRRQSEQAQIEVKQFTLEEIELGMGKLRRRIEEVQALDPRRIQYDDQRVRNAEMAIDTTILEVFGQNSPEYRQLRHHQIIYDRGTVFADESEIQEAFAAGIPQTIMMLESLIARLEEKRGELAQDATARIRAAFEGLDLHPRIAGVALGLYRNRHYRNAVLDAYLALENLVKERSGCYDLDGATLMRRVFSRNNPILAFNDLSDETDLSEQEGMMHLFEGAALALRNPRAHSLLPDTPEEALESIAFLSLLARRVERAQTRANA